MELRRRVLEIVGLNMHRSILITGATGFIGSNLTRHLLKLGNKDLHIFVRENSNLWRIGDILSDLNVHKVDLLNKETLKKTVSDIEPDVIYHNVAYGATYRNQQDSDLLIKTNFIASVNLLESLIEKGFQIFINSGSCLEYGLLNKEFEESDLPNPVDLYGVTKLASTNYYKMISLSKDLPIVTLRIFFSYGYYESSAKLIPYLITSMLRDAEIVLHTPYAKRDYFFIDDLMDAFIKTNKKIDYIPRGSILNIGSGIESTPMEIFKILKGIVGYTKDPIIIENYLLKDKLPVLRANIAKARSTIDWEPRIGLKEGLRKAVQWFEKNLDLYEGIY